MRWGPYRDAGEASGRLTAYANAVYARPVGVLWVCGGQSTWLRRPAYDGAGNGLAMLVRCEIAPPPPIRPTALESVQNVLAKAQAYAHAAVPVWLQMEGVSPGQQQWLGKHVIAPVDAYLSRHPAVKDGLVVVGDVAGVIAGVAAGFAIATAGGAVAVIAAGVATVAAGFACAVLLWQDAQHLWFTTTGNEGGRIALEHNSRYQWIEAIAPLVTLPDLAIGGVGTFRDAVTAGRFSGRAGSVLASRQTRALGAKREFCETIAGGEAGWHEISMARAAADKRARDLQVMQAMARRANHRLLLRRNNVLSTLGGTWGARQYYQEPPDRAKPLSRTEMGR